MAGQKIFRAQMASLIERGSAGQEHALEEFARGVQSKTIARDFGVNIRVFYKWIEKDPALKAAWQEAKLYRARSFADEAQQDAEDPTNGRTMVVDGKIVPVPINSDHIAHANLKVKTKMWLAAVNNPKEFGKAPEAVINIEHLHLTALERVNAEDTAERMKVLDTPTEPLPAEIVPEEDLDEDLKALLA